MEVNFCLTFTFIIPTFQNPKNPDAGKMKRTRTEPLYYIVPEAELKNRLTGKHDLCKINGEL